jgi:glycosyltransferase involved in cell wall biosynthesis
MENLVSVVVPLHDPDGQQLQFLDEMLRSISNQTLVPFEVIIASNHEMLRQTHVLSKYLNLLPITLFKNDSRNAPNNLNLSIAKCTGKYVKILFQDDLLVDKNYIASTVHLLEQTEDAWGLITSSEDFDSGSSLILKKNRPRFSVKMLSGKNFFGSPSTITIRKKSFLPFLEQLVYLYDCEWYTRMVHNWGMPLLERSITTQVRIHRYQSTNTVKQLLASEIVVAENNHNSTLINGIAYKYFLRSLKCKCQLRP